MNKLVALLSAAASLVCASTALAQPTTETTVYPVTKPLYNNCNDEIVIINGEETVTTTIEVVGNDMRYSLRDQVRGTGTSDKGTVYTYDDVWSSSFKTGGSQAYVDSLDWSMIVLRKQGRGRGGNLVVLALRHTTTDSATGDLKVNIERFKTACR